MEVITVHLIGQGCFGKMKRFFVFFVTLLASLGLVALRCLSQEKNVNSFILSTWNVGHFSNGKKNYSLINGRDYYAKVKKLRDVLEDSIRADVICINEYNAVLGIDSDRKERETKRVLLNKYITKKEGKLMGFSCNSVFSNLKLKNIKVPLQD